ncbi:MAG: hypothetical protein DDT34_01945 [Firmicutes bacterium]|nr:hypothetical protein [Bacillota bacterium]
MLKNKTVEGLAFNLVAYATDPAVNTQSLVIELSEYGDVTVEPVEPEDCEMPDAVRHGRTIQIDVPDGINRRVLGYFLDSYTAACLLGRIYLGHSLYWEGKTQKGRLDADAKIASAELIKMLNEIPRF